MGKIMFDKLQKPIVEEFLKDPFLTKQFYFTGGTALSLIYIHHRQSEDLDFFSEKPFPKERIISFMNTFSKKHRCSLILRQPEELDLLIFDSTYASGGRIRVDFNHYPFPLIEKGKIIDGLRIDSLRDIATNKLITINQRTNVKDFVDLYFLFQHYTLWDLLYGVEAKFGVKLDLAMIASDFLKVEEFDFLPKMLVPLTNQELTAFFKEKAREIGKRITK
ncbi:nucleotidyl transferase AbiEii/AbiGii toxin family protein [Candidatus Roizmanbacteria bacterium]|nr:nucleotidyl transferase AbiEii/AbiGii toxin family protein [Candidatus Roizmanbacteria bacterium]